MSRKILGRGCADEISGEIEIEDNGFYMTRKIFGRGCADEIPGKIEIEDNGFYMTRKIFGRGCADEISGEIEIEDNGFYMTHDAPDVIEMEDNDFSRRAGDAAIGFHDVYPRSARVFRATNMK